MRLLALVSLLPFFTNCGKTVYYHDTHTTTPVPNPTVHVEVVIKSPNETNVNPIPTTTPVVECYSACHGKPKGTVMPTPKPTVAPVPTYKPTVKPTPKPTPKPTAKPYY